MTSSIQTTIQVQNERVSPFTAVKVGRYPRIKHSFAIAMRRASRLWADGSKLSQLGRSVGPNNPALFLA
jgi:hypothetical protein